MICPVCGNNSPDSLRECQFCSTPLTPAAPAAPQYNPATTQFGAQQAQYGSANPQMQQYNAPVQQPHYGAAQAQYGAQPFGAPAQQSQYGTPQIQYGMQPYGAPVQQTQYGTQPYGAPAQQQFPGTAVTAQPVNTEETAETETTVSENDAETAENEKKVSKGTLAALLVWFAFMAIAFAALYFDLPGKVNDLLGSALPKLSASDVNAPHDGADSTNEDGTDPSENAEPVLDALHGTWVLCTYYVQDLTTNNITGGQHYTHPVPLQFFTFNAGTLNRCAGSAAAALNNEELKYSYSNNNYSGPFILGGTETPSVVLGDAYMCVYDTFNIDGVNCYVEYALLRVFDEPATQEAIKVYAEAIENGGVALPQYTSSVMTNPTIATSAPTASTSQISATYGMLGTWLLTKSERTEHDASGQPTGNSETRSIADNTLDYNYVVFRLDNAYRTYSFSFSDDMSECINESKDSGSYEFADGLLDFAPASSRTAVNNSSDGMMYMEYDTSSNGATTHYRDTYILISTDAYSRDDLINLRPEIE